MDIRTYRDTDQQAVADLWREVFPDAPAHNVPERDIAIKLAVQRELFFVATEGAQLVGTAMAGFDGHRGWVYYLAVAPEHRRRGIGKALMNHAEHALYSAGCPKLNLMIRAGNEDVVAFYRRLGYEIEDRICMARKLGGDE
ncbi:MAG: GNAT family acetyltransferase [Gammaproteobacteria bacterium]